MLKRIALVLCSLLVATAVLAGCSSREAKDSGTALDPEVAALRDPMLAIFESREEMLRKLDAGDLAGARQSYATLAAAFGEVLSPISFRDEKMAQAMANAHSNVKEEIRQNKPDKAKIVQESQVLTSSLQQVADALGLSLIATASAQMEGGAKAQVIDVQGKEYQFIPPRIEVAKGARVTIRYTNVGTERHEFELEAFDKEIEPIQPGTTAQMTFVADKAGEFEYACHVDDHYQRGMKGTLVVK